MIFTVICYFLNLVIFSTTVLVHFVYYNAVFVENVDYAFDFSLLIAIAAFVCVSLCGCCCYKKNQKFIFGIGVVLLFIFISGFIEGVTDYYRFESMIEELVDIRFNIPIQLYHANPKMKIYWDKMQGKKCCGIKGPEDWKVIDNGSIPLSCCPENITNNNTSTVDCFEGDAYSRGCKNDFVDEINCMSRILMITSGIIAMLQICVMIITCCAILSPKKDDQIINFDSISTDNSNILPKDSYEENNNDSEIEFIENTPKIRTALGRGRNRVNKASDLYTIMDDAIQHKLRNFAINPTKK